MMPVEDIAAVVGELADDMPSGMVITLSDPVITQSNRSIHLRYEGAVILGHLGLWESETGEITILTDDVPIEDAKIIDEAFMFETADSVRQQVRRFIDILRQTHGLHSSSKGNTDGGFDE
jgi:hypothetical protein